MERDRWHAAGYYNDTVKPPKQPGELAIQVWAETRDVLQIELDVFRDRSDIGEVRFWFGQP